MSQHDIEDLVADTIIVLDAHHPADDPRVRDWITALYRFQDGYDCSFTRFRVMDVLLSRRHTYRFDPADHPDHAARGEFFASVTEFTALRDYDEDAERFDDWLEDGYLDPPHLYCDAGTDLWRRMCRLGRLSGPDAQAPARVPLIEAVHAAAVAAEERADHDLISLWWAFGHDVLLAGHPARPFDPEDLADVPLVPALKRIVVRTGAMPAEDSSPQRPPDDLFGDPLEHWWWTPEPETGRTWP